MFERSKQKENFWKHWNDVSIIIHVITGENIDKEGWDRVPSLMIVSCIQ